MAWAELLPDPTPASKALTQLFVNVPGGGLFVVANVVGVCVAELPEVVESPTAQRTLR